jgi:hypothetical protein
MSLPNPFGPVTLAVDPRHARPQLFTIITQQGETTFTGVLATVGTSQTADHTHPVTSNVRAAGQLLPALPSRRFAAKGERCNACRWFEVSIYVVEDGVARTHDSVGHYAPGREYVVHTVGQSRVPEEKTFQRVMRTTSAFELVEFLTVRKPGDTFLPEPSARALARLADVYDDVREAYVNRAVM